MARIRVAIAISEAVSYLYHRQAVYVPHGQDLPVQERFASGLKGIDLIDDGIVGLRVGLAPGLQVLL